MDGSAIPETNSVIIALIDIAFLSAVFDLTNTARSQPASDILEIRNATIMP